MKNLYLSILLSVLSYSSFAVVGPITGPSTVCISRSVTLSDTSLGGIWSSGSTLIATVGSSTGIVTGVAGGTVDITYTVGVSYVTSNLTVNPLPSAITGPSQVCAGLSVTETNATPSGTWSSSNPTVATTDPVTGFTTGVSVGVVTITYTLPTGCASTGTFTVNTAPGAIVGPVSACVGTCITETDIVGGGTWTIVPTTIASVGSTTGIVCGVTPGIATLTYSIGAGCSATTTIVVNPLPAVVVGSSNICIGSTVTLTDGSLGGTWTSSNTAMATVGTSTGVVTGVGAGILNINYTLATGCYRTKVMTVNPSPTAYTVTGGGSYCAGGMGVHIGLAASTPSNNYQLYNGAIPIGGPLAGTGVPLDFGLLSAAGTYTIKATVTTTGCTQPMTGSAVVGINPLPIPYTVTGGGSYCSGGTGFHVILSGSTTGINYQLYNGVAAVGSPIAGTGGLLDFGLQIAAGTYTAVGTSAITGCTQSMSGSATITINPAAIISGPSALCPSATITLTGTPAGGTWTSSNPAVATIGSTVGLVTGVTMGTTAINYTLPTGCMNTVTVTVSPGPSAITGPTGFCIGAAGSLTDPIPGGTWTSSSLAIAVIGSLSGVVTGLSPGVVTITYSLGTGCIVTKSVIINNTPAPITGSSFDCIGLTTTLSDATLGGTWTTSIPTVAMINPATGLVTGISTGSSIISYSVPTGCSATKTISVSTSPAPISGTSAVCVGSTTVLSDIIPGGTWSSSNPAVASIAPTGIVAGISPGTAIITYSLGTGCITTIIVTVLPAPAPITGPTSVCVGATISIAEGTPGGTWSSSNPAVATISMMGGGVTGISPGVAVISYSLGTGCTATKTIAVNPIPSPISGLTSVCIGNTITLTEAVGGGTWSSGTTGIASINTSGVVTGVSLGTAIISYTIGTGCNSTYSVTVTPGPCFGMPTGGTAIAGTPILCTGINETLSLSGASTGCGITYQWQDSPDGTTFTDLSGASSSSYTYNATISKYYRCKVTCINSGLYAYSSTASVVIHTIIATHSISSPVDSVCNSLNFYVSACGTSSSFNVTTWFGDGTSVNTALTSTGICYANILHSYDLPGTYFIKQVLYIGTVPQDTATFSYEYLYCHTLPFKFYFDANSNCVFDSGDKQLLLPVKTEIDSNGIAIDTISTTSGFYYVAKGLAGTVYSFRVISTPGGFHITCPAGAVLYDTIQSTVNNYHLKYFGLNCGSGPAFDLVEHVSTLTGRHRQSGTIIVDNTFCPPEDAVVTLHFSPRYNFHSSTPVPTSVSGNTATWNFTGISSDLANYPTISYWLEVPSAWLIPGDTVHSSYLTIGTITGDIDTSNNVITKNDTVRSSYDPNEIVVSPTGKILPCTQLQYTIRFENTGNDTAHNISVLDTLSDNLDPRSLNLVIASSVMNIAIINDGVHHIAKFDFPHINLPDSSHHNQCNGMLIFNIKAKSALPDGAAIFNHAGIFFDDNPAVMTDTVENVIGVSPITGLSNVCTGSGISLNNTTTGGTWSSSIPAIASIGTATGNVTGISAGTSVISYSLSNSCAIRFVTASITVNPTPPLIIGLTNVCESSTTILTDSLTGGTWTSSNTAIATIDSDTGIVSGITADTAIISYTLGTGCKTIKTVTVNPLPVAITGTETICSGTSSTLSDATTGGTWSSSNPVVATIGSTSGIVTSAIAGTTSISYTLTTGCLTVKPITVDPLPATFTITGGGSYCAGDTGIHIGLSGSAIGTDYLLYNGPIATGTFTGSGAPLDFGLQTVAGIYTVVGTNTGTTCSNSMTGSTTITINPAVTPSVSLTSYPGDTVCVGTPTTFTPIPLNGGSLPTYLWNVNGTNVAVGDSYTFLPANGDVVKVTLTSNAECATPATAESTLTMSVIPPVIPSLIINANPGLYIAVGENDTLTVVYPGDPTTLSYQWVINSVPIPNATSATYISNSFFNGDNVRCDVINNTSCVQTGSAFVVIMLNSVGIKPLEPNFRLTISPNPNKGDFTIQGTLGTAVNETVSVIITDMIGHVVYTDKTEAINGIINERVLINNELANGMYMLNLHAENGNKVLRFVIEK